MYTILCLIRFLLRGKKMTVPKTDPKTPNVKMVALSLVLFGFLHQSYAPALRLAGRLFDFMPPATGTTLYRTADYIDYTVSGFDKSAIPKNLIDLIAILLAIGLIFHLPLGLNFGLEFSEKALGILSSIGRKRESNAAADQT